MGDVFDAMNRAQKERQEQAEREANTDQTQEPEAPEPERPSLPLDDMVPPDADEPGVTRIGGPVVYDQTVTVATQKARAAEPPAPAVATETGETGESAYAEPLVAHRDKGSPLTEQYRAIRTQILARGRNRHIQVSVLTCAAANEG